MKLVGFLVELEYTLFFYSFDQMVDTFFSDVC